MTPFVTPLMTRRPRRMSPEETDAFARRAGWVDDIAVITAQTSVVDVIETPWWDGVELIVARDPSWPEAGALAAYLLDDHLRRLDGTSQPIHEMNARRTPRIDADTVLPYLGFFCFFVRAEHGPFGIVESADDWLLPEAARHEEATMYLRPAAFLEERDDGLHCEATVWYSDALFLSNFVVDRSGMIEMVEDEPLVQVEGATVSFPLVFGRTKPAGGEG